MLEKSYVYENMEVVKTGRIAQKTSHSASGKEVIKTLIEIKPVHASTPLKWVSESDLFEVL